MSDDVRAWFLEQLWSPIVAVTAAHDGRTNGLISSTALNAGLVPEAPRVSVHLGKHNLSRDLVLQAGVMAIHLLPANETGLALFSALGTTSGHDRQKLDAIAARPGETGSPILVDAVSYVEARVTSTLDSDELTIVLADVVAAGGRPQAPFLTIDDANSCPPTPSAGGTSAAKRRWRQLDVCAVRPRWRRRPDVLPTDRRDPASAPLHHLTVPFRLGNRLWRCSGHRPCFLSGGQ
jgi:flavin reductase (DIM6/NTAB) family NADH-FMN oxidoreductase RutF